MGRRYVISALIINRCLLLLVIILAIGLGGCGTNTAKNNPLINKQWYLNNYGERSLPSDDPEFQPYVFIKKGVDIDAAGMWGTIDKIPLSDTVVAIIDTGIAIDHEDLFDNIWNNKGEIPDDQIDNDGNGYIDDVCGFNFCRYDARVDAYERSPNENMHGTECAGIIGAMDNERGIKGIAKVQIMVLKAFDNNEDSISIEDINHIVEAIKYAEDNGAKVCNMSFSSKADSPELYNAMKSSSMLFVVSAGNGMPRGIAVDHSVFPAAYKLPNMITVANMNYGGFLEKSSNFGKETVDIMAPGTSLFTTTPEGYGYASGTSMATAVVSGVAGLLFSLDKTATAIDIKRIINSSVTPYPLEDEKITTGGLVNGKNAVQLLLSERSY